MSGSNTIIIAGEEYSTETAELELSGRGLVSEDIKDIGKIKNLSALYMPENGLTDISALKPLSELKTLYLQYNSISDIEPLAGLDRLTDLKLNNNRIKDISALKNLTGLKRISLQNNNISDITALQSLAGIEKIYLDGNPVRREDIEALRKALPECEIECGDIIEAVQSEKPGSNTAEETVTVKSEKSKRPVILAAMAMAVIAVIAAAAANLTRNSDDFSVSETESFTETTETAAVSEEKTTAPETTLSETTVPETSMPETTTVPTTVTTVSETTSAVTTTEEETETTPETTTEPPFTSYIPVKYNFSVPDIVPLYMREEYSKNPEQYFSNVTFDIDDEELLYLTVNAHFIRCYLFMNFSSWSRDPNFHFDNIKIKFDSDDDIYYVWSSGVSFQSFIDYASTVFTQDYISKLTAPHYPYESIGFEIPLIVNTNDELYLNITERGTNPGHEETFYYVQTKTENKATVVRESVQLDFYEKPTIHTYYYIDLVKTPDGWRYDGFPMFDEYYNDVYADGTPYYTDLYY